MSRELIQKYEDTPWRATRTEIVRELARHPEQRALEFLFELSLDVNDTSMAELAVWSLGQTHHPLAGRFLVELYGRCSELLKPAVAAALGQLPNRLLAKKLHEDLRASLNSPQIKLTRNLILTLGELKYSEALPTLLECISKSDQHSVLLSALISVGKIARDSAPLMEFEERYMRDLLEYQIYSSVRAQVQFRSEWTLEDYLKKMFDDKKPHPSLPYELNDFDPRDVKEGLKLYPEPRHLERLCLALSKVDTPDIAAWYQELIDITKLDAAGKITVLKSLSHHLSTGLKPIFESLESSSDAWYEAVCMALPDAEAFLAPRLLSTEFGALPPETQISALNHLVNFGLISRAQPEKLKKTAQLLQKILDSSRTPSVQARALRGLASLKYEDKKLSDFVRSSGKNADIAGSALVYAEHVPAGLSAESLLELPVEPVRILSALTEQKSLPVKSPKLAALIESTFGVEALRLLARHPIEAFLPKVHAALTDKKLQLQAIITLKAYGSESSADLLAPLLTSKDQATSGRALDTLTALPGLRAKRLVIDHLRDHPEDEDVCSKIVRCLEPPASGQDYFCQIIDVILEKNLQPRLSEELSALRDRISSAAPASVTSRRAPTTAELLAIEAEIRKNLPAYDSLEDSVKSTLRSAEIPFSQPELYDESVDKAASVLQYCKSIDMLLEKNLGQKHLFPRIERSLHELQNVLHLVGLDEDYPNSDLVYKNLGLPPQSFTPGQFPLHKMRQMAIPFLNSRIVNDRLKVIDGLRAWAVILILYCRKIPNGAGGQHKALITLSGFSDAQVIQLAQRLIALQEIRNPAAHRQTYLRLAGVNDIRTDVYKILNAILGAIA